MSEVIAFTVILDKAYKDEDAESIRQALSMVKGVARVESQIADPATYWAMEKAKRDLQRKLWNVVHDD